LRCAARDGNAYVWAEVRAVEPRVLGLFESRSKRRWGEALNAYNAFIVHDALYLASGIVKCRIAYVPHQNATSPVKTTLSFRVPAEQLSEIDEEILKDHRKSRSDLVEPIWDWAWKEYKKVGSLKHLLEGSPKRSYTKRVSEQTQEELYIALETILKRAPSAVIEDVARLLIARAGKYGEGKPGGRK
jgi:hypothetical protein